jgi:polar amino acid transport system substrate-binding protein
MRIKIKSVIVVSLALFFLLTPCAVAENTLQICTFEYPLFMSKEPIPERGYGFLIDSTNAALEAVGLEPNYHFFPMKRSIAMATNSKYDAFLGTIAHFPKETRDQFSSIKMGELRFIFFYLKDENHTLKTYDKLADLNKYRIGTVRGSSSVTLLKKSGIEPDFARNLEINFNKLLAGRIDLCVALELPATYIISRLSPSQQSRIAKIDKPLMSISVDFIVNRNNPGSASLFKKVKKGLQLIKNNGTYQDIVQRYYGKHEI